MPVYVLRQVARTPVVSREAKAFILENPTAAENIAVFATATAKTLTSVKVVLRGTSPSVTFNLRYGTDRSAGGTAVFASDQTVTGTTTLVGLTIASGSIPANGILWLTTSAISGTVTELSLALGME